MTSFAHFPYEVVETTGEQALATWEALKKAGRGAPVVFGDELENLLFPFDPDPRIRARWIPVEDILAEAQGIDFPDDLVKMRDRDEADALAELNLVAWPPKPLKPAEAPLPDEWPEARADPVPSAAMLDVAYDILTGKPRVKVHIALIPTDDFTAIPAYLNWGNFNECPSSAYHVAALRVWRDHYGAELVGLDADKLNLRVALKPATREEALDLARVLSVYCSELGDQSLRSCREIAARLLVTHWWDFWWD